MLETKKLAVCTLTSALLATSQGASAHSSIRDTLTEGTTAYNAVTIGHGCEQEDGTKKPVRVQTVLFPGGDAVASYTRTDSGVKTESAAGSISKFIEQASVGDLVQPVQDRSVFNIQGVKKYWDGTVIGFYGSDGYLNTDFRGVLPFRFSAVNFLADDPNTPFNESCAKSLKIKVAIADICDEVYPPKTGSANLWIPDNTSPGGVSSYGAIEGIDGIGSPATLTINRKDPVPTDGSCDWIDDSGTHTGYDVNIWPWGWDLDYLLINNK